MKKHASTIGLLVAALVLGVWLWLDRDKVTEGEKQRRDNAVFAAWRREELSRIEIDRDDERVILERDPKADSAWRLVSPRKERADQQAVERLLTTLEFASVARRTSAEGELGLEAPRAHGIVSMGGLALRFSLGAPSPRPEGSSYFRVDDDPPFVVSKELTDALLAHSDTYRDRTVIPYLSLELATFEVSGEGGGFALERLDERAFRVKSLGVMASREALDRVWGALAEMRAESFANDAEAERLTAHPRLTIRMTAKDAGKPPGELVVGEACPGHPDDVVVLRKQPTRVAACAPRAALEALLVTPESLVEKRPFTFRVDEIEEVRLEWLAEPDGGALEPDAGARTAPVALELARKGSGFHQREPVDRELSAPEADAAGELLSRIERSLATSIDKGGADFVPVARARVHAGQHDETVELSKFPDDPAAAVIVRRLRDDARLAVTRAVTRRLVPRKASVQARAILPGETRRVERVMLRCGTPQDLIDEGHGLTMVEPRGYETDGSITQLVDAITRGKADAWVADADDGSFGFETEECRVVLGFEGGNSPVTIRLGAEGEGGVYGRVEGKPSVFVASLALETLARRVYVSHASLRSDPERVENVRVTADHRPARGVPLDDLRDAVGSLYADGVVTLGPPEPVEPALTIEVTLAEAGAPRRIACGAMLPDRTRHCSAQDVRAVFSVPESRIARFLPRPDAGASQDAGQDAGP